MTTAATPPTEPPGPTIAAAAAQRRRDEKHLRLLVMFYYVLAGLTMLFACGGLLYLVFGIGIFFLSEDMVAGDPNAPPEGLIQLVGGILAAMGVLFAVLQVVYATLAAVTAHFISTRRYHTFCLVSAGLTCMSPPLGTALGIFTFVVLTRPGVSERFAARTPPAIGR